MFSSSSSSSASHDADHHSEAFLVAPECERRRHHRRRSSTVELAAAAVVLAASTSSAAALFATTTDGGASNPLQQDASFSYSSSYFPSITAAFAQEEADAGDPQEEAEEKAAADVVGGGVAVAPADYDEPTYLPLPPSFTSIPLEDLLNNGTVHDGNTTDYPQWGPSEIPIVESTRTDPFTPEDLGNATTIASGYRQSFELFKVVYERNYSTVEEETYRYWCFVNNMANAFYNQTINPYALFGANNYSDMTPTEFLPYHNLTDDMIGFQNRPTRDPNAPPPTDENGYEILQNDQYGLEDTNGEFTVRGKGSQWWKEPTAARRDMAAAAAATVARRSRAKSGTHNTNTDNNNHHKNGSHFVRVVRKKMMSPPFVETFVVPADEDADTATAVMSRTNNPTSPPAPKRRGFNPMVDLEDLEAIPSSLDWRTYGAVSDVQAQGFCGGCWAFSTAGNIEGQWYITGHALVPLSEQSLISCDIYTGNMGCSGGVMQYAFDYILKYQKGYMGRKDAYPYASYGGSSPWCAEANIVPGAMIENYISIAKNEDIMMQYVASNGPISIAVDTTSWQSYVGGIITNCIRYGVDHAVLIVGYDNTFRPPYWIIKNSWGTSWGEKGYVRIGKGSDQCLVTRNPSTSIVPLRAVLPGSTETTRPATTTPDPLGGGGNSNIVNNGSHNGDSGLVIPNAAPPRYRYDPFMRLVTVVQGVIVIFLPMARAVPRIGRLS